MPTLWTGAKIEAVVLHIGNELSIRFPSPPPGTIVGLLRGAGFRWIQVELRWLAWYSEDRQELLDSIAMQIA